MMKLQGVKSTPLHHNLTIFVICVIGHNDTCLVNISHNLSTLWRLSVVGCMMWPLTCELVVFLALNGEYDWGRDI
jgi:hypothetical protein